MNRIDKSVIMIGGNKPPIFYLKGNPMKKIGILGSTGSIGTQALELINANPERYTVTALSCRSNAALLIRQIEQFSPELAVVEDPAAAALVEAHCIGKKTRVLKGLEGLLEIARSEADLILTSLMGSVGLLPTLEAIEQGKTIALANKETLVTAGRLVMERARARGVAILPVDSEHSAIFQALQGNSTEAVSRLILTASGGAFRDYSADEIRNKKAADALKHPNWSMGSKITIDSATLMNKGLEVIEARWLFDMPAERIEVVVHPQSIIHSMVEYQDSSVMAQMGLPDMRLPIHYAFNYPGRVPVGLPKLDFTQVAQLTFDMPDMRRFPCLGLAYDALRVGGTMPCVLNAANEVLVERYLQDQIAFYDISDTIEQVMSLHDPVQDYTLETLLELDRVTRIKVTEGKGGRF